MALDFSKQLQSGSSSADAVIQAREEIKDVLEVLNRALKDFLQLNVTLEIKPDISLINPFIESSDFDLVNLKHDDTGENVTIFKINEDANGYPVTIQFQKNSQLAYSKDELGEALGTILSNPQFHLVLRKLKDAVERKTANP